MDDQPQTLFEHDDGRRLTSESSHLRYMLQWSRNICRMCKRVGCCNSKKIVNVSRSLGEVVTRDIQASTYAARQLRSLCKQSFVFGNLLLHYQGTPVETLQEWPQISVIEQPHRQKNSLTWLAFTIERYADVDAGWCWCTPEASKCCDCVMVPALKWKGWERILEYLAEVKVTKKVANADSTDELVII